MSYTLVITGPIGAGKSTQCQLLRNSFSPGDFTLVPEFIDDPDPERAKIVREKMTLWTSGRMDLLDFRSFVAESQDRLLSETTAGVKGRILERLPSDASILASAAANREDEYTFLQSMIDSEKVEKMGEEVEKKHGLASDDRKNWGHTVVIDADQDPEEIHVQIKAIVDRDLNMNLVNGRVIKLCFSDHPRGLKACVSRIIDLGQRGEFSYNLEYLDFVCRKYNAKAY